MDILIYNEPVNDVKVSVDILKKTEQCVQIRDEWTRIDHNETVCESKGK